MDLSLIPVLIAVAIGVVGLGLMVAAFALVRRRGGWQSAMQPDAGGCWSAPRRLMYAGALLGVLFAILLTVLFIIPGGLPWLR